MAMTGCAPVGRVAAAIDRFANKPAVCLFRRRAPVWAWQAGAVERSRRA
jgi:hypothetical protein